MAKQTFSPDSSEKEKTIDLAISSIEKQFGKGSIMRLGAGAPIPQLSVISSGSIGLDIGLGVGGYPRGRIIEIFGPESSGKTTLALHVIAEAHKKGGIAAFVDAEHALDPNYAQNLGVKIDDLLISQPDFGEQALEIVDTLVRSGAIDVIVLDSVAALVPRAEIEGEMGDAHVGLQARLMSQALRKITATVGRSNTLVIFVNQTRMKIGTLPYMNPETTSGGMALRFYSSVRIDVRRIGSVKDGEEVSGNRVRAKVVKNKVSPPFRDAEFDIMFGSGISQTGELVDMGSKMNIVEKSGTWFSYGGERLGQGRENSRAFLKDNPDIAEKIKSDILTRTGVIKTEKPQEK
ncbi:MAG: recombinase RecA [Candidatus Dadabacteria bacterium RIFCSPHIGHO2_12_FULL_53_21]|nr:MAG: recombinase RecA [Candidatus Dadabacteria bacterium RIFCSPHIGHO2_12_FULL_53_21]